MTAIAAVLITLTWTTWWEPYDRLVIVAMSIWSLATLAGMIAVPSAVRARARRRPAATESIPDRVVLEMTCPRCGAAQQHAQGLARCVKCRLRVVIDVEEPRCACGYLLFRLEGDLCPECGRVV